MAGDSERPPPGGSFGGEPDQRGEAPAVFEVQLPKPGLSRAEKKNLAWLFCLYFVHAIPLQFSWSSMPILLRQQLSYADVGTFIISQYPYSWKVIWSPIVEAFYVRVVGRRKTWIVPSFIMAGAVLLVLALAQDDIVARVAGGETSAMTLLVLAWLPVMVLCGNIRIALDSWSLDLLSQPNVHLVSPVVIVAETAAGFLAFNIFVAEPSRAFE
jgi:PAT family acetyl-CoA transporter-like MFS transporter 1